MNRKFGHIERMLIYSDSYSPLNVVAVLRLTNAPSLEIIQAAVDKMQQRQPMLRTRIRRKGGTYFYETTNQKIEVEAIKRRDDEHWRALSEERINTQIDIFTGPLVQAIYLAARNQPTIELIFTFHHTIMDGVSGENFFIDLMKILSGKPLPENPNSALPAVEDGIPEIARGLPGFMMRMMRVETIYRIRGTRDRPKKTPFQLKISTLALTEDETRKLVRQSRKSRVTLHSALHAAFLLAKARVVDKDHRGARQMRTIGFADLRPFMVPPMQPTPLGPYFSMLPITLSVDPTVDFQPFVKRVHDQITSALKKRDQLLAVLIIDRLIKFITTTRLFRAGDTAVSYSGPIEFASTQDGPKVAGFHAFIGNIPVGPPISAHSRLYKDRLCIDMVYLDNELGEEEIQEIGEVMLGYLK